MNYLTCDFETYYKSKSPGKYSLKGMTRLEYVTDPRFRVHMLGVKLNDGPVEILRPGEIPSYLRSLKEPVTLIGQNLLFDGFILARHYKWVPDFYLDLKYLAAYVWNGLPTNLKAIAERLWPNDPSMHKGDELALSDGVEILPPSLFDTIAAYCAQDVKITQAAVEEILNRPDLPEIPQFELNVMNAMIRAGVEPSARLDTTLLQDYLQLVRSRRKQLIEASGVPQEVLSSNVRFAGWLADNGMEVPLKISPTTGKPTYALAKNDLQFVRLQEEHPEYKAVWEARAVAKSSILESRTERFLDMAKRLDGRCVFPLKYGAAHTLRAGGTDKLNMQNMPRNAPEDHPDGRLRPGALRRAITADPGHVIVVGDLSNIEARVAAVLADQKPLIKLFEEGGDPYAYQASKVYKRPINKKDDPAERQVGKALQLGLGYGMGRDKFVLFMHTGPLGMDPIRLPIPELHKLHAVYRQSNPEIVLMWKRADMWLDHMLLKDAQPLEYKGLRIGRDNISPYVQLPLGTKLRYYDLRCTRDGYQYRSKGGTHYVYGAKLHENVVQGMAGELLRWQMGQIEQRIKDEKLPVKYLLQVHDELVYHVDKSFADEFKQLMYSIMTTLPEEYPYIPLDVSVDYDERYTK